MDEQRAIFIKSYSNVPEILKKDIVVVLNEKPYSWDNVYFEIKNDNALGRELLKKMRDMDLI